MRHAEITEAGLGDLVERFYGRARLDPVLGPVFARAIQDWPPHIAAIKAFWARAMLGVPGYDGNAFARHQDKGIEAQMFDRWLDLWRVTAEEVFEAEPARLAVGRAELIARGLKSGLFFAPDSDRPGA